MSMAADNRLIIQIYEAPHEAAAKSLAALDIDHVGLWAASDPIGTALPLDAAKAVFAFLPNHIKKVVLTLTSAVSEVSAIIQQVDPDIVHIGARPHLFTPEQALAVKERFPDILLMRSIPVRDETDIHLAQAFDGPADFLLLDTFDQSADNFGATGKPHNWNLSRQIVDRVRIPVILAGGLGPENVVDAIAMVKPAGVDSKSKTDLPDSDEKNLDLVQQFIKNVRDLM